MVQLLDSTIPLSGFLVHKVVPDLLDLETTCLFDVGTLAAGGDSQIKYHRSRINAASSLKQNPGVECYNNYITATIKFGLAVSGMPSPQSTLSLSYSSPV